MNIDNKDNNNPNPLIHAGWISKTFFWWIKDFILKGRKQNLVAKDVYNTIPEDLSETLCNRLEIAWRGEKSHATKKKRKPSLWKALARTFGWDFLKRSIFSIGFSILMISGPYLLQKMMSYFVADSTKTQTQAYLNATIFIFLMILRSVFFRHSFFHLHRLGIRAKIACSSLIYKKMLKISTSANGNSSSSAMSLLTVDVSKFDVFFLFIPYIFMLPIQLIITTYLIWQYVEFDATLTSIATMSVLTLPVLAMYDKIFFKLRKRQIKKTDERLSLIGEVIDGIKSVKMFVWEKYFEERVHLVRRAEIRNYLNISYVASVVTAITSFCHRFCVFIVILIYVPLYGIISPERLLPVSQHFNNLQYSINRFLFYGLRRISDVRVSIRRIEDFLLLQEVDSNIDKLKNYRVDDIVMIDDVTASWKDEINVLKNINLILVPKNLHAIVGAVGSGKSSLLKLILGELSWLSGKVYVNGKVSYASQKPWLFPGSLKDNILFGEVYDEDKYNKVVSACALLEDFTHLPYADETLVGDRGMNLSGGQCARVNLARAVYRDADIYLFDNPLSAVDTRVAKKLMDECINGLLQNKTRVLVTHNVDFLRDDDDIIVLDHGAIKFRGTLINLKKSENYSEYSPIDNSGNLENNLHVVEPEKSFTQNISSIKPDAKETEELIAKGLVKMSVYSRFIRACGFHAVFIILFLIIIYVVAMTSFDYGLVAWNQDNKTKSNVETTMNATFFNTTDHVPTNQTHASLLLGVSIFLMLLKSMLINANLNRFILNASNKIHNNMISQLLKTTLRFFEVNPSGRIMNRFSEDTRIVDDLLSESLSEVIQTFCAVMALLISALIISWWIIIPSFISIILHFLIGKTYLATVQKVTRLVGTAKSPVLSFVTSSLDGLATIRACDAESFVKKNFDSRQDRHTAANFLSLCLMQANALWVELSNLVLLASIVYVCIVLKNDDTYEGYVGLALMQAMNMTAITSNMMLRTVQALSLMPNVERMLQFADLEVEDSAQNVPIILPNSWPDNGEIELKNLYLRYSDDSDPVLWNLNFTIVPGSKVGIVGRTGAGKSSLISALFRLAKIEGSLLLDGIDISEVDLLKLRSKISIIPQEPFLFKASLRKNIDPLDEFEDALLWSALEDVELKELFVTLDYPIESGGINLSLGQRQLLCLARAILKKNKILILDEATANIDLATDALIQKTIKSKFMDCTVLTIAHRLETVMDSDKILVMDNGRIAEFDHPFLLLQNDDSYFYNMVQQTDDAMVNKLKAIAKQAYENQEQ